MYKKLIAFLLVIALCFSITPQAYAVRIENSISLNPYAFTTDDNIFREFSNFGKVNIVMEPGEWTVTPAFHAVDGWVASYSGFSAVSSDPDVADAKIIHVGASPVGGIANSFIGLEIHAKKAGTTVITVSYATFVTNSRYTDNRGTPYSSKQFVVTVADNTLQMDVAMSTNEVVLDWPEGYRQAQEDYTKKMAEANELFATKLMTDGLSAVVTGGSILLGLGTAQLLGAALGAVIVPGGALVAGGLVLGIAINCAIKVGMDKAAGRNDFVDEVKNIAISNARNEVIDQSLNQTKTIKKINIDIPMGDAIDFAEPLYKMADADLNTKLRKLATPTMYPQTVTVEIRLTNPGTNDITDVVLALSSENLSFSSDQGPWADSKQITIDSIPAGQSIQKSISVHVKPAFHNLASGTSQQMYTGNVAVNCSYYNGLTQKTATLHDSAELKMYTKLNQDDLNKAAQYLLQTENKRGAYIMCPVDVHILDREGNTLAVLTTDGEPYQDEFITAGSMGDAKYFIIPQDKKDDYQLKIVAVDDGSMHVAGMDGGKASNVSFYSDIALKKGDSFFLDLAGSTPAVLNSMNADGTQTKIDPTLELNEDSIAEALKETDVSEENRRTVAHAMARSLVPLELQEEPFQNAVTLEQYAQLVLNLLENQLDMFPGDLTDMYLEENPDAKPISLPIAAAVWKGLLDQEYANAALEQDAATRLLTNEEAQMMLTNYCDIMEYPEGFSLETDPLTLEQMICVMDALWQAKALADKDIDFTVQLTEEARGEMTGFVSEEEKAVLYYRENEIQTSALRNSMVYYPVYADVSGSNMVNQIVSCINLYTRQQRSGTHPGTPIDVNLLSQPNLRVQTGLTGSGNQVTDKQGWTYNWYPFFLYNQSGSIYMNTVYLFVLRVHQNADTTVFGEIPKEDHLDNRVELYIVADQEVVGNFLATQYLLDEITDPPKNYQTLDLNSEGEAVLALQKKLSERGYYTEESTGVYDGMTRQAVSDFQRQMGLPVSGVADDAVQKLLHGDMSMGDPVLELWLAPYLTQAKKNASIVLEP